MSAFTHEMRRRVNKTNAYFKAASAGPKPGLIF